MKVLEKTPINVKHLDDFKCSVGTFTAIEVAAQDTKQLFKAFSDYGALCSNIDDNNESELAALKQNTELRFQDIKIRFPKWTNGNEKIDYDSILEEASFSARVEEPLDVGYVYIVVKPQD